MSRCCMLTKHCCSHTHTHRHRHTHTHTRTPAIRFVPSALNQCVVDPDALHVLVCENTLIWMTRQRRGMEGVIKLKRLGEDELLRTYESRQGLYNPNPVHSASKDRQAGRRRRIYRTGVNPCVWTKMNQAIGFCMTIDVRFLFNHCFCRLLHRLLHRSKKHWVI